MRVHVHLALGDQALHLDDVPEAGRVDERVAALSRVRNAFDIEAPEAFAAIRRPGGGSAGARDKADSESDADALCRVCGSGFLGEGAAR